MVASSLVSVMVRISLDVMKTSASNHFEIKPLQLRVPSQTSLVDVPVGVFLLLVETLADFFDALVIELLAATGAEERVPDTPAGLHPEGRVTALLVADDEGRAEGPPVANDVLARIFELLVDNEVGVTFNEAPSISLLLTSVERLKSESSPRKF